MLREVIEELEKEIEAFHDGSYRRFVLLGLDPEAPEMVAYLAAPCDLTYRMAVKALKKAREEKGMGRLDYGETY